MFILQGRSLLLAALATMSLLPADTSATDRRVTHSRIRLPTGVELHLAEAGPADGQPVLLLHGYADSWYSWAPVLERLPDGVRAIVPTLRGHGDSERPACCYRLADFAADAVALLDALGIQRAHVVGHSMGSLIAQRLAIEHPERVERLALVGSTATAVNDVVVGFNEVVQRLEDPIDPAFIYEFEAGTAASPLPPVFLAGVVAAAAKAPARVWRDAMAGLLSAEAAHDLSRIRAPTLVVWGEHDGMFGRSDQDSLLRAIPGARLLAYGDAAHSPNWEVPDRITADLVEFLGLGGGALLRAPASAPRPEDGVHPGARRLDPVP